MTPEWTARLPAWKNDASNMSFFRFALRRAQLHCVRIALGHYENFFVLGPLTPLRFTPHLAALYAFSRYADDLADEITDDREGLKRLESWRQELRNTLEGHPSHRITKALECTVTRFHLPPQLLFDLLDAFQQDLKINRYDTFDTLRDYTRRSADPVGRLVLRIYGYNDPEMDVLSDFICTGLQLANFCQDVGDDARRNRIYIPLDECRRFEVDPVEILDCTPSPRLEGLLRFQIVRAYKYLLAGLPLAERLEGRLKMSVRLFALGGLQILDTLERDPLAVLHRRVRLNARQKIGALLTSFNRLKQFPMGEPKAPARPISEKQK